MVFPEIWIAREQNTPREREQKQSQRSRNRSQAGLARPGDRARRCQSLLRNRKQRVDDRGDQEDYGKREQPVIDDFVNRKRKQIKAKRLVENRIGQLSRSLMRIESKAAPCLAHSKSEYQTRQHGNDPGQRSQKTRGRNTHRLLIDQNRAGFERERSEGSLDQPKSAAQNHDRNQEEDYKQLNLQPEHVPVDLGEAERAKPQRRDVD